MTHRRQKQRVKETKASRFFVEWKQPFWQNFKRKDFALAKKGLGTKT